MNMYTSIFAKLSNDLFSFAAMNRAERMKDVQPIDCLVQSIDELDEIKPLTTTGHIPKWIKGKNLFISDKIFIIVSVRHAACPSFYFWSNSTTLV